jgi:hypothetical protein
MAESTSSKLVPLEELVVNSALPKSCLIFKYQKEADNSRSTSLLVRKPCPSGRQRGLTW